MKFNFATVVFGDAYVDMFLRVSLPNLLSPGNLMSFKNKDSVYKIYTTPDDAKKIRESPVFLKLSEIMPTELYFIGGGLDPYKEVLNMSVRQQAAFVMLAPDMVWSDGTFANLQRIAATGKKAVMLGIYYASTETFESALLKGFYSEKDLNLTISSRDLVKLSLEHSHYDRAKTHFWDSTEFTTWPGWLFWSVDNEGVLSRRFHLHPLMLCPSREFNQLLCSVDGSEYIPFAIPNYDDIYVIEDSDEAFTIEMCSSAVRSNPGYSYVAGHKSDVSEIANWVMRWDNGVHCNTNPYHRKFLKYKLRMHHTDISHRWEEIERSSDDAVNSICSTLKERRIK